MYGPQNDKSCLNHIKSYTGMLSHVMSWTQGRQFPTAVVGVVRGGAPRTTPKTAAGIGGPGLNQDLLKIHDFQSKVMKQQ